MTHVNMISPTFVAGRRMKRAMRLWCGALIVTLLSAGAWAATEYTSLQRSVDRLRYIQVRHAQCQAARAEIESLHQERKRLQQREHAAFDLEDDVLLLDLLGIVANAAETSQGTIHVTRFVFSSNGAATQRRNTPLGRTLTVEGVAADNLAIAKFAAEVRRPDLFDSVELDSTGPAPNGLQPSHRTFRIECSLAGSLQVASR